MADNNKISSGNSKAIFKLALTAIFVAIAVVGSLFSIPVLGSRCSPVQHLVNILCAVFLGPSYAVLAAFLASTIRLFLGLGTLMAFPGSMVGALLSGLLYKYIKKLPAAWIGELFGTSVLGGMLAYPVAYYLMGNESAALFVYVLPFFISSCGGTIIAAIVTVTLEKSGFINWAKAKLEY